LEYLHQKIDTFDNILLYNSSFLTVFVFISFFISIFAPNKAIQSWQN